jgi:hypothetical protein
MTTKMFQIEDKGYVWRFPADLVAHNYAKWYEDEYQEDFDSNYNHAINDENTLYEWFANNMNWEDIAESAALYRVPAQPTKPSFNGCLYMIVEE